MRVDGAGSGSIGGGRIDGASQHAVDSKPPPGAGSTGPSGAPATGASTPPSVQPSTTLKEMAKDGTRQAVLASAVGGKDATLPSVPPGVVGGAGLGTAIGASKPVAGDFVMKDPATRGFFMDKSPKPSEFYKLDLAGPLREVSPEYFGDLKVRNDTYISKVGELPEKFAIPENASVATAEAKSQAANQARNQAMDATREAISQPGKEYSKALKETGAEWQKLADRNAQKLGASSYADASAAQKLAINREIVKSSGRSNVYVDALVKEGAAIASDAKFLRGAHVVGKGLTVVGAAVDAYSLGSEVKTSLQTGQWENSAKEATRIGVSWALAAKGAAVGAAWGSAAGPFGTVVGGLVGGAAGYLVGSGAVEYGWSAAKSVAGTVASWFQ